MFEEYQKALKENEERINRQIQFLDEAINKVERQNREMEISLKM